MSGFLANLQDIVRPTFVTLPSILTLATALVLFFSAGLIKFRNFPKAISTLLRVAMILMSCALICLTLLFWLWVEVAEKDNVPGQAPRVRTLLWNSTN